MNTREKHQVNARPAAMPWCLEEVWPGCWQREFWRITLNA